MVWLVAEQSWLPGAEAVPARRARGTVVVRHDVVIGVDVGKHTYHACALDIERERLLDQEVEAAETAMWEVFESAWGRGGVQVMVHQLHTIGAMAVSSAESLGFDVAYLPSLSMRRVDDR